MADEEETITSSSGEQGEQYCSPNKIIGGATSSLVHPALPIFSVTYS